MKSSEARIIKRLALIMLVPVVALVVACSQPASISQKRTSDRSGATAAMVRAQAGFVYTADERGNSISVIDLATGEVKTIATRIAPHNLQVFRDGRLLLAVGEVKKKDDKVGPAKAAMAGTDNGRLLLFHIRGMVLDRSLEISLGHDPAHVLVDANERFAYVTNSTDNDLAIVDLPQKRVVGTIATGKMPHGMRMSPDGSAIYIANVNDNNISVIDVGQAKDVARIAVGKAPVQVGFTPNGRFVYVANQGAQVNPDNTVSVIDTTTNSVVATITTGRGAHGVLVSDDRTRAFITNIEDGTVSVIDVATKKVIVTIKVGKGPNGITFRSALR